MPRAGPRRPLAYFRISQSGLDRIDQRARDEGLLKPDGDPNRSDMIRTLLAYAVWKMPNGWRPSTSPAVKPPSTGATNTPDETSNAGNVQ